MPLNPKVRVSTGGIHGNCWWANEDIFQGEWIWKAGEWDHKPEALITAEELKKWPKEEQDKFMALAYMISPGIYSGFPPGFEVPDEIRQENFVNHSCEGNSWYESDALLVANRDIKKGEEITYDYALTESEPDWSLNCLCGKPSCRKQVTGNDWTKQDLQEKYGNHFLPYINELIAKRKSSLK